MFTDRIISVASIALAYCTSVLVLMTGAARAAIPDAAGKTGGFQVTLKDFSPLSPAADIAKRMPMRGKSTYDLAEEPFDVYVPKTEGADGKYGLVILLHFRELAKPPAAWEAVLDKHHLIWMGDAKNTDGRHLAQRVGLVLDAVYNAESTWPIDPGRVFLFDCTSEAPTSGVGLYYPDVFDGTFQCNNLAFYRNIPGKLPQSQWPARLPKISDELLTQAKTRRYYFVERTEDTIITHSTQNPDIFEGGYQKAGFDNAKLVAAKTDIARNFPGAAADWFEEGITYLDVKPEVPAVAMSAARPAAAPQQAAMASKKPPMPPPVKASPAPAKADAAVTPPPAAPPPVAAAPPPADSPADLAKRALALARSYVAAENYDTARTKLQKLIADYPDTPSAKEAASLLNDIKDK